MQTYSVIYLSVYVTTYGIVQLNFIIARICSELWQRTLESSSLSNGGQCGLRDHVMLTILFTYPMADGQ